MSNPQSPPTSLRDMIRQQAKAEAAAEMDQSTSPVFHSFHQEKHKLVEDSYDSNRALTYEEGLAYVRNNLKKELAESSDELMHQSSSEASVNKDKVYFRERYHYFQDKIQTLIEDDEMSFLEMSANDFINTATAEIVGWDVLSEAFANDDVTDIFVYAYDHIVVECDGENVDYPQHFRNEQHYNDFLERLVYEAKAKFNKGEDKICDFDLYQDRFNIVHQAVAVKGHSLTIRKHSESHVTLSQILAKNGMDQKTAELFRLMFKGQCSFAYAGLTGSGKTTTLRALADEFVPSLNRRALVAEDTRELFLQNPQTVDLVTVKGTRNITGVGLGDLVVLALRLKPKYIFVGEIRSSEAADAIEVTELLQRTNLIKRLVNPFDSLLCS